MTKSIYLLIYFYNIKYQVFGEIINLMDLF